jgi:phage/plasmid-like protein (TIGR03299 family)
MPMIDQAERQYVIANRINAGQDTYAGRLDAWHKLGAVTGQFQTYEEMEVLAKANYEVVKKQLEWKGKLVPAWGTFRKDFEIPKGMEDQVVKVQTAEGKIAYLSFLATVGQGYTVIQHTEGFKLLDSLVGSIQGAHYETMGTLDFGRVVWGQVDPNIQIRVGDDVSDTFLTFLTSHDGSMATEVYETATRQVCSNTVRIGRLGKLSNSLRVKHTKNAGKKMTEWKAEIEEIRNVAMTMQERLNYLANRKVTKLSLEKIMDKLFPKKKVEGQEQEESSTRRDNILAEILAIYDNNDGNQFPEQRGTAYNLLNAVTNYTDHVRATKNNGRAESAVFGSGDKMKTSALQLILDEAENMVPIRHAVPVSEEVWGMLKTK